MTTYIAWSLLLVAVLILGVIAWQVREQYKLLEWPQVTGTMVSCEPVLGQTEASNRPVSMWTVRSRYMYSVGGTIFQGHVFSQRKVGKIQNRVAVEDTPAPSIAMLCQRFPPGSSVQVYYDAADPKISFIYFNPPITDWEWLIFPAIAGLLAWFFFAVSAFAKRTGR